MLFVNESDSIFAGIFKHATMIASVGQVKRNVIHPQTNEKGGFRYASPTSAATS